MTHQIATGCYSRTGRGRGTGVEILAADPATGSLTALAAIELEDPSFVAWNPNTGLLHAVHETSPARLTTLRVRPDGTGIETVGSLELAGSGACHVAVGPGGRTLLVADYGSGHIESVGLDADGVPERVIDAIDHARLVAPEEQDVAAHPHQAVILPGTELITVPDLGLDRVMIYREDLAGHLDLCGQIVLPAGSGPRHLTADHESSVLYVACELSGELAVIGRDPETVGDSVPAYTVRAILPASGDPSENFPSHVEISARENHVLIANRGPDSLSSFGLGLMRPERVGEVEVGAHPRDFARIDDGLVLVAAQEADRIDAVRWDGRAFTALGSTPAPSVTCIAPRP